MHVAGEIYFVLRMLRPLVSPNTSVQSLNGVANDINALGPKPQPIVSIRGTEPSVLSEAPSVLASSVLPARSSSILEERRQEARARADKFINKKQVNFPDYDYGGKQKPELDTVSVGSSSASSERPKRSEAQLPRPPSMPLVMRAEPAGQGISPSREAISQSAQTLSQPGLTHMQILQQKRHPDRPRRFEPIETPQDEDDIQSDISETASSDSKFSVHAVENPDMDDNAAELTNVGHTVLSRQASPEFSTKAVSAIPRLPIVTISPPDQQWPALSPPHGQSQYQARHFPTSKPITPNLPLDRVGQPHNHQQPRAHSGGPIIKSHSATTLHPSASTFSPKHSPRALRRSVQTVEVAASRSIDVTEGGSFASLQSQPPASGEVTLEMSLQILECTMVDVENMDLQVRDPVYSQLTFERGSLGLTNPTYKLQLLTNSASLTKRAMLQMLILTPVPEDSHDQSYQHLEQTNTEFGSMAIIGTFTLPLTDVVLQAAGKVEHELTIRSFLPTNDTTKHHLRVQASWEVRSRETEQVSARSHRPSLRLTHYDTAPAVSPYQLQRTLSPKSTANTSSNLALRNTSPKSKPPQG